MIKFPNELMELFCLSNYASHKRKGDKMISNFLSKFEIENALPFIKPSYFNIKMTSFKHINNAVKRSTVLSPPIRLPYLMLCLLRKLLSWCSLVTHISCIMGG